MDFVRLAHRSDDEGTAIDVGANLGLYCELLAPLFKRVIAFEPQPDLAKYLKRVLPKNVEVHQLALSNAIGEADIHIPKLRGGRSAFWNMDAMASLIPAVVSGYGGHVHTVKVKTATLDDMTADVDRIDFVKIDVEGHENAVLDGAAKTIDRHKPVMLIEIEKRHNAQAQAAFKILEERGYISFEVSGSKMEPAIAAHLDRQISDPAYRSNYFFIHQDDSRLMRFRP
ncbi:FkbM family methyltransferase [Terrarubrum flagellatum]|uniref:FkbM family methyltransferase n=1 Tax=Terrirubrum flagellatum TaxID=2895980 RepID=UPI003144D78E